VKHGRSALDVGRPLGCIAKPKTGWLLISSVSPALDHVACATRKLLYANSSNVCNFFAPALYSKNDPVRLQSLLY
jgi:hypothetical protein